jgi:hypothetical protein
VFLAIRVKDVLAAMLLEIDTFLMPNFIEI